MQLSPLKENWKHDFVFVVLHAQVTVESMRDDKVGIIYEPKALIKAIQQSIEGF